MEVSKWKEKLSKLPSTQGVFSKVKAVFSATLATANESEPTQHLPANVPFEEVRAYQLEAELARAQAQEMAQRLRQRMT